MFSVLSARVTWPNVRLILRASNHNPTAIEEQAADLASLPHVIGDLCSRLAQARAAHQAADDKLTSARAALAHLAAEKTKYADARHLDERHAELAKTYEQADAAMTATLADARATLAEAEAQQHPAKLAKRQELVARRQAALDAIAAAASEHLREIVVIDVALSHCR